MSEYDAITAALIDSNQAQAILEKPTPTTEELKEAAKLLKKAAKTVSSSVYLLTIGVNTVRPGEAQ